MPGTEREVEKFLDAALAGAVEPTPAWRQEAQMLAVVALAMQGKAAEARKRIADVTSSSPAQLLALASGIQRAATTSAGTQARAMAQLQLDVVRLLEGLGQGISADQRRALMRRKAEALAVAGQRNESLAIYQRMAAAAPKDGALQEDYAQLLLDGDSPEDVRKALKLWRSIEKRSRPRSERWLRSKYALALAHVRLDDRAQAKKIIAFTRVLAPELGGAEMKEKFEALLK